MLGNPPVGIEDLEVEMVAQIVLQRPAHYVERAPLIMAFKVFDVFQDKERRSMMCNNPGQLKEHRALTVATKAVGLTQCPLGRQTGLGKRLARESGHQQVVRRYRCGRKCCNVAGHGVVTLKIGPVSGLRVPAYFAGKHATRAQLLQPQAKPAYAGKQVNKRQWLVH